MAARRLAHKAILWDALIPYVNCGSTRLLSVSKAHRTPRRPCRRASVALLTFCPWFLICSCKTIKRGPQGEPKRQPHSSVLPLQGCLLMALHLVVFCASTWWEVSSDGQSHITRAGCC